MSYEERLLWILGVGAVLYFVVSTFGDWWRSWRKKQARKKLEEAARREREGPRRGHVAGRYKPWDPWLKKIGYPRRGTKSNQD